MLCWTSAPPTTRMFRSPVITGQVVGATKQTCGFTPARAAASASGWAASQAAMPASSGARQCRDSDVALVDTLELQGGVFDAGVLPHPALLLRGDRIALAVC